jgi:hypothetical protein
VVLGEPDVAEPHLFRVADLLYDVSDDLGFLARVPRSRNADLVEQSEIHGDGFLLVTPACAVMPLGRY